MLLFSNILLLVVNAVTSRREFYMLFNRAIIIILLYICISFLSDIEIGVYSRLFLSKELMIAHSFSLFPNHYSVNIKYRGFASKDNNNNTNLLEIKPVKRYLMKYLYKVNSLMRIEGKQVCICGQI